MVMCAVSAFRSLCQQSFLSFRQVVQKTVGLIVFQAGSTANVKGTYSIKLDKNFIDIPNRSNAFTIVRCQPPDQPSMIPRLPARTRIEA